MDGKKIVFQETAVIAIGLVICVGIMLGIYALLGKWDNAVLLGGLAGGLVAILNFFFMAVCTSLAADKAQAQDVKGGQALLKVSYLVRIALVFVVLFACIKSGWCSLLPTVLPLVFIRPILTVAEFFRKSGEKTT